jgi:nicotinate-nucleotide adenylyltransferase
MLNGQIRVGIYGGTFAPVHNGHVAAAQAFYDALGLDELLVIPTYLPPHKATEVEDDPAARLAMTELAFEDDPRNITVSGYEIEQKGTSYTYKTLQHFTAPDTRLTFLCGTDMFLTFDSWKHPEIIFRLARIAHVRRESLDAEEERQIVTMTEHYRETYGADILHLDIPVCELSSTEVRTLCREGKDISHLVPPSVLAYIAAHRLYGNHAAGGLS